MELREQGKRKEALAKFRRAYEFVPTPITGLAVGVAHEDVNDLVAALDAYEEAIEMPVRANESAESKTARKQTLARRDALLARIPRVRIAAVGLPPNRKWVAVLDGKEIEASSDEVVERRVNPGPHRLAARAQGFGETEIVTVLLSEKQSRLVELHFTERPPVAAGGKLSGPVASEEHHPIVTSGGIGVGYGHQSAGVGIVGDIEIRTPRFAIAPYVGIGHFRDAAYRKGDTGLFLGPFGLAVGTLVGLRFDNLVLFLDVGYGLAGVRTLGDEKSSAYGVSVAVGGSYTHPSGFFGRVSFGITEHADRGEKVLSLLGTESSKSSAIALTLCAGFRIW